MKIGQYEKPKFPQKLNAKIVCIIPLHVAKEKIEGYVIRGCVSYDIYKDYVEDKIKTIEFMLACHKHYKAGVDYEIILINNGTQNEEALSYFEELKKEGYTILDRENTGFSFGGYKYAWDTFREKYDYYLFHEQDIIPSKDGWLQEIVLTFLSSREIGVVGNVLESRGHGHPLSDTIMDRIETLRDRDFMYNLDGVMSFTSSRVLKEIEKIGGLKIEPCDGTDDVASVINETGFQQPMLELGYQIISFNGGDKFCTHGICVAEFEGENIEPGELAPMIHCHVRDNIKWFRKYFNWYADR